jgi:hypothetical protein
MNRVRSKHHTRLAHFVFIQCPIHGCANSEPLILYIQGTHTDTQYEICYSIPEERFAVLDANQLATTQNENNVSVFTGLQHAVRQDVQAVASVMGICH